MTRTKKIAGLVADILGDIRGIHPDDPSKLTHVMADGTRITYHIIGVDLRNLR